MCVSFPSITAKPPSFPSKTAGQESFPVALRWLAGRERAAILAFYQSARSADDWADRPDPVLTIPERLDGLALVAAEARTELAFCPPALEAFEALLPMFEADARGQLPEAYEAVIAACRASSEPVGRFLLRLHGESPLLFAASDALCLLLQLLNHLRDEGGDTVRWGRPYLPDVTVPALTALLPTLLRQAEALPLLIRSPGLRRQAAATVMAARRQMQALKVGRRLRGVDALASAWSACFPPSVPPPRLSGSFRAALPLLPRDARSAVALVYAVARQWDSWADDESDGRAAQHRLLDWRQAVAALGEGRWIAPLPVEFLALITRYRLPLPPFLALLDGMLSDLDAPIFAPDASALALYCDRVAGAVGSLILAALGVEDDALARAAGRALQLTNILRDLEADAAQGRVYLPRDAWGGAEPDVGDVRQRAAFLIPEVEAAYAEAFARLKAHRFAGRRAVWAMVALYHRLYRRLCAENFAPGSRLRRQDAARVLLAALVLR
jgi:hydroxysqualene synthase